MEHIRNGRGILVEGLAIAMKRILIVMTLGLLILATVAPVLAGGATVREYRILLKPERFQDPAAGIRAYWDQVRTVARKLQIPVHELSNPILGAPLYIQFLDTAADGLHQSGYRLLRRQKKPFSPTGIDASPDFVLEFGYHHGVQELAAVKPVQAAANYPGGTSFREEISVLPAADKTRFDRSGTAGVKENLTGKVADFARVFPGLLKTGLNQDLPLTVVRQVRIRELSQNPGSLLCGAIQGQVTLSVWYRDGQSLPLIAEFSVVCPVPVNPGTIKAMRSAVQMEKLMSGLRAQTRDWIWSGTDKSRLVYGK